jgi:hypothetical protein
VFFNAHNKRTRTNIDVIWLVSFLWKWKGMTVAFPENYVTWSIWLKKC